MLKKLIQRLSDPIFYQRRWALFTQRFRKKTAQQQYSSNDLPTGKALVVVAHPDDEVFCSGLICDLRERGTEIHLLCLTKGEGGPLPDGISREQLGEIRAREMEKSCEILGIEKLTFLGHIDPQGTEFRTFAPAISPQKLADQIREIIDQENPDLLLTHGSWGEYWHPAHLLVHKAVHLAGSKKTIVTFNASREEMPMPKLMNHADVPHLKCDFPNHFERRLQALEAHETQLDLFAHFADNTSHTEFVRRTQRENYSVKNLAISAK